MAGAAVKPNPNRKGWMIIPGVQPIGDRTIESQMKGLDPALAECSGKTVLDLGCAEGAIALAFAKAGAASVLGLEYSEESLNVARWISQEAANVSFRQAHLKHWVAQHPDPEQYDIVLALGIVHKFHQPADAAHFVARSARNLICFRAPGGVWDGIVKSKHTGKSCDWFEIMAQHNFVREQTIRGDFDEGVEYWRRA